VISDGPPCSSFPYPTARDSGESACDDLGYYAQDRSLSLLGGVILAGLPTALSAGQAVDVQRLFTEVPVFVLAPLLRLQLLVRTPSLERALARYLFAVPSLLATSDSVALDFFFFFEVFCSRRVEQPRSLFHQVKLGGRSSPSSGRVESVSHPLIQCPARPQLYIRVAL